MTPSWASAYAQRVGPAWPVRMVSYLAWVVDILQDRRTSCQGGSILGGGCSVFPSTQGAGRWNWYLLGKALAQKVRPSSLPLLLQSAFPDAMQPVVSSTAVAFTGAHVIGLPATASAQLAGLGTSVRAVSGVREAGRFCQE